MENAHDEQALAVVAHELRNLLTPILTAARTLRDVRPEPAIERAGEIIERQARHLARVIDDLVDVQQTARGTIRLEPEAIALQRAVREAIESCRPGLEAKQLRLEIALPAADVVVVADPTRVAQIATNLLANAVKFTPPAGTVGVSVFEEADDAVLVVRDSGVGIAPELLPHVFDPFTRAESDGGLGVGLAVAKRLVELHHGRIEARSEGPGRGAEFIVRFPLPRAAG